MVRANLRAWGYSNEADAITLAVSELVTNAVIHGQGLVEVSLTANDGTIRIEVADQGGGRPKLGQPDIGAARGGWGLRFVDELADDWGSTREGTRTSVWMERHARAASGGGHDGEPS